MAHLRGSLAVLAFACVLSSHVCAYANWYTDLNEARREAERLQRPIVCHFGAIWCAPCQKMERSVFNQAAVIDQLKATAICVKIDVDKNPELVKRFGVDRFPTDIIIEPNGQRLMESTGYQSADDYIALVDRASRRYSDLVASRQTKPSATVVSKGDANPVKSDPAKAMLEGYCPVTLSKSRQWVEGNAKFQAAHKDQVFYFASDAARKEFVKSPEKFAPQFMGCDPILLFTADRAVAGSIEWGAYFDDRLYLFTNEDHRRNFKENPEKYVRTQVVLNVDKIESTFH